MRSVEYPHRLLRDHLPLGEARDQRAVQLRLCPCFTGRFRIGRIVQFYNVFEIRAINTKSPSLAQFSMP